MCDEGMQVLNTKLKLKLHFRLSGEYPRALRLAAMALFIGGGLHLRICHFNQKRISYFRNIFTILFCIEQNLAEYQMRVQGNEFGPYPCLQLTSPTPPSHISGGCKSTHHYQSLHSIQ